MAEGRKEFRQKGGYQGGFGIRDAELYVSSKRIDFYSKVNKSLKYEMC
jgi:hypothetical protein